MDINKIIEQLKQCSNDYFLLHDMVLPISAEKMYGIMCKPENWQVVNFPIINRVEVIEYQEKSILFFLHEKLLKKYYKSHIVLTYDDEDKHIEYYHSKPAFPFVNKMASTWFFVNENEYTSHFYIIRRFNVKNLFIKYCLFWFVKMVVNKHVADYYDQLIALTKTLAINSIVEQQTVMSKI